MRAVGTKFEIDKPTRSAPWTRLSQRMRSPREDETHPRWAIIEQVA